MEDYTQQNRWDYRQQNCDWAAIENFKSNLRVLIVKKVVLSNQKTPVFYWSLTTKLSKNAGSPNLSLAPFKRQIIILVLFKPQNVGTCYKMKYMNINVPPSQDFIEAKELKS